MNPFERIDMLIGYARIMDDNLFINQLNKLKEEIMSISTPMTGTPVQKYIEIRSDEKRFVYFDKSKGEKGERVTIPQPFYITVLDDLITVSGYNKQNKCGFKSNEIHDISKEPLKISTWKGDLKIEGLWNDIKADCAAAGAKFTRSIYALLSVSKTKKELVHIQLHGTANSEWIDLKVKPSKHVVKFCDEWKVGKNGKTEYNIPVLELMDITPELLEEGVKVDTEVLQPYFRQRDGVVDDAPANETPSSKVPAAETPPPGEDDLPFTLAIPIGLAIGLGQIAISSGLI